MNIEVTAFTVIQKLVAVTNCSKEPQINSFSCKLLPVTFFNHLIFVKLFQECILVAKQHGSRLGPTFCLALSGSKVFVTVINRGQNSPLAGKELILAKSSNCPSAFYEFSSKREMLCLVFLHLEIARYVMYTGK